MYLHVIGGTNWSVIYDGCKRTKIFKKEQLNCATLVQTLVVIKGSCIYDI